jgi:hypothetical protein
MLRWSSNESGVDVDLTTVADGTSGGRSGSDLALDHGEALLRFATACAEEDDEALATARAALVDDTDAGFMVDAAAVAANFEMMTRLADGTGSRMPADRLERSAAAIGAMGVAELTSRR